MTQKYSIDSYDDLILKVLVNNARASMAEIGEAVNLSPSAVHRRIKLLEQAGVIEGYHTVIDYTGGGFAYDFFVEITLNGQSEATLEAFEAAVQQEPEILECYLMTGSYDYLIRLRAQGRDDYERIHRYVLSRLPAVQQIHTGLVLRKLTG